MLYIYHFLYSIEATTVMETVIKRVKAFSMWGCTQESSKCCILTESLAKRSCKNEQKNRIEHRDHKIANTCHIL